MTFDYLPSVAMLPNDAIVLKPLLSSQPYILSTTTPYNTLRGAPHAHLTAFNGRINLSDSF